MASADFSRLTFFDRERKVYVSIVSSVRSPRVLTHSFLLMPVSFTTVCSVQLYDFDLFGGLINTRQPYELPVRQASSLPPPSSRRLLTLTPLASAVLFPLPGELGTFTH